MLQEVSCERFVADPIGKCVVQRTFIVWCASATLSGTILWGTPDASDVRELLAAWSYDLQLQDLDLILDARRLLGVDGAGLDLVSSYLGARVEHYRRILRRQALIIPPDSLSGTSIAGVAIFLNMQHPWRAFGDEGECLAWLARDEAPATYRELHRLVDEAQERTATLIGLREHLREHLDSASMEQVSRALGCSSRTLQRCLREQRTSFRDEVRRARVREGSRLLASTDLKLEAVARAVGYASSSHFAEAFLEETGEDPLGYRKARRGT